MTKYIKESDLESKENQLLKT